MFAKITPNTRYIGQKLIYFKEVDSTNNLALELCRNRIADHGTIVLAELQTNGKGQLDRNWHSISGLNLTFSVVILQGNDTQTAPFLLNKAIALAVYNVVRKNLEGKTYIKWPNDIYHNGKKISGILIENSFSGQQLQFTIAGIGININENMGLHPDLSATSFYNETHKEANREKILTELCEEIEIQCEKALAREDVTNTYLKALSGYRELSRFSIANGNIFSSKVYDVDEYGRIAITINDEIKYFEHGEIKQII
ncbi:MAG: biotin--[acetyl-CoA-carboxylase] ligase [Bacteroidia bacterium]|nr:biotin--[acetyl-CoA-carboxylase] ligase [Bacteroidia bacterium]